MRYQHERNECFPFSFFYETDSRDIGWLCSFKFHSFLTMSVSVIFFFFKHNLCSLILPWIGIKHRTKMEIYLTYLSASFECLRSFYYPTELHGQRRETTLVFLCSRCFCCCIFFNLFHLVFFSFI